MNIWSRLPPCRASSKHWATGLPSALLPLQLPLLNGVPIESVSKMMGHTNIRTTQLYAKMLDEKVASDMAALREIFAVV